MSDLKAAEKADVPSKRRIKQTAWHPGFCAAIKLECREWRDKLTFLEELPLGSEPNIIDLVVIKKNSDVEISNLIGRNFRGTNILEFKSPDDGMTVDDFYMALSYACEYKSQGDRVNARRSSDITVTLVQEKLPRKMFEDLKDDGAVIENPHQGLYVVNGMSPFFTQVVVYGGMTDEDGLIRLRALTKHITVPEFERLADEYDAENDLENRRNLHALLSAAMRGNVRLFNQEEKDMLELSDLKVLFKKDFAEAEAIGEARGIDKGRAEGRAEGRVEGKAEGRAEGRAEGKAEGRAEGRAEGKAEGRAEGIISMGREFRLSNENIISRLMAALKIPAAEAEKMLLSFA